MPLGKVAGLGCVVQACVVHPATHLDGHRADGAVPGIAGLVLCGRQRVAALVGLAGQRAFAPETRGLMRPARSGSRTWTDPSGKDHMVIQLGKVKVQS